MEELEALYQKIMTDWNWTREDEAKFAVIVNRIERKCRDVAMRKLSREHSRRRR